MDKPPRRRNDPVLTRALVMRVAQSAFIIMVGTMLVYTHEMLEDGVVDRHDTTMTFTCFVLFDMFNALPPYSFPQGEFQFSSPLRPTQVSSVGETSPILSVDGIPLSDPLMKPRKRPAPEGDNKPTVKKQKITTVSH